MNSIWKTTLQNASARVDSGSALGFGDANGELVAAQSADIVADLSHLAVLGFHGDDAEAFLQGQLSCDIKSATETFATLGGYCTPKGRMLASFLLMRWRDQFVMLLSTSIAAQIQKRLGMYVLRSKVTISSLDGQIAPMGLAGPTMAQRLSQFVSDKAIGSVAAFDTREGRKILLVPVDDALAVRNSLGTSFRSVGPGAWQWIDIREGIPLITAATQDQLVPQMANLELIGGVSFKKGCYPGQEIVARTQYLGRIKRRMFRAHVDTNTDPGTPLYRDDFGDQASGLVVNVQPSPAGGFDLLVVSQLSSRETSIVRLGSSAGPALMFEPLPYEIS